MDASTRHSKFRFRLRTISFVPGAIALLLVAMQQVQITRQQAQIKQLKQQIDSEGQFLALAFKAKARTRTRFLHPERRKSEDKT
jgi:uncharacterized membrane protein affecting hemolysin expression